MIFSIEDFIESFNNYEAKSQLFHLRDAHGFPWWDLVRYRVQFALCVELGIFERRFTPRSSTFAQIRSFSRQSFRLLTDATRILTLDSSNFRSLVVSTRHLEYLTDALLAEENRGYCALLANKGGQAANPHKAIDYQTIPFFVRLAKHLFPPSTDLSKDAHRVATEICHRFNSNLDIFSLIKEKYSEHLASMRAWAFVLNHMPYLDKIYYVNDDTLKTLVFQARISRISTIEVQHAYMGRSHFGFSYPPLTHPLETLPDKVVINRDTGDITYPVQKVVVQRSVPQTTNSLREIDVLIAASPTNRAFTLEIVESLVNKGLSVAIKLHPSQHEEHSGLRERFPGGAIQIYGGSADFCALVRRAYVFVPANPTSTTAFEAVENGARLVIIDLGGLKKTAINDGIVAARSNSLEALYQVVLTQLPDYRRCFHPPSRP